MGRIDIQNLNLEVPEENDLRDYIRATSGEMVRRLELKPILYSYELAYYAEVLIQTHGLSLSNKAFAMICLGNEVWRPMVASVPFERRILLLPECLKSSGRCVAQKDAFGLLCQACSQCSIGGLVEQAEMLGYNVIVSEGTTGAKQIFYGNRVEAVIGVGCMEVLKNLNENVTSSAIPSIGVPLLRSGCVDTLIDIQWLLDEIRCYQIKKNQATISLKSIKDEVDKVFTPEEVFMVMGECNTPTQCIARDYLLVGGKRLRPLLFWMIYKGLDGNLSCTVLSKLALAIECFHKASLIHDDIEDNDIERYGEETLHHKYGVPIAINIGDYLIGQGYSLIAECGLDPQRVSQCLRIASQGHVELAQGQGDELYSCYKFDIPEISTVIDMFKKKTSAAFRVSLLMGGIAADATNDVLEKLDTFSTHIGIAYQLKDDLEDFEGEGGDFISRKFSILLSLVHASLSLEERGDLISAISSGNITQTINLIDKTKAREQALLLLKKHIELALSVIRSISSKGVRLYLSQLVAKIFCDYV